MNVCTGWPGVGYGCGSLKQRTTIVIPSSISSGTTGWRHRPHIHRSGQSLMMMMRRMMMLLQAAAAVTSSSSHSLERHQSITLPIASTTSTCHIITLSFTYWSKMYQWLSPHQQHEKQQKRKSTETIQHNRSSAGSCYHCV